MCDCRAFAAASPALSTPSAGAPTQPDADRIGAVFHALADPTRRSLIETISESPEATPTSLASELPISRQAVSKHLAALADAGLVEGTRHGREHPLPARASGPR